MKFIKTTSYISCAYNKQNRKKNFSQFIKYEKVNVLNKSIDHNSNTIYHAHDLIYDLYSLNLVAIDA